MSAIEKTKQPKKDRREYMRSWYAANREKCRKNDRERMAEWRAKNPERTRAAHRRANKTEQGVTRQKKYQNNLPPGALYKTQRKASLKKRYNLTPEQWDTMFAAQGFACANQGCRVTAPGKSGWHTDHCHTTSNLRAILCKSCNITLGMVKDDPEVLRGLAKYLEQHSNIIGSHPCSLR